MSNLLEEYKQQLFELSIMLVCLVIIIIAILYYLSLVDKYLQKNKKIDDIENILNQIENENYMMIKYSNVKKNK